jgi:hypothetical protein
MDKKQTPYVLPELAYDYGALEPYISGHIMELHHDKHHRGYVEGANRTLEPRLQFPSTISFCIVFPSFTIVRFLECRMSVRARS